MWRIGCCFILAAMASGVASARTQDPDFTGGTVYRAGGDVKPPSLVSKVEPSYSDEARNAKISGSVLLSVVVDPTGVPRDIRVTRPLGLGLDEKAIEAVSKWRFAPGMKDGKPVSVRATIDVSFRLLDNQGQQMGQPMGQPRPLPTIDNGPKPASAEEAYRRGMRLLRANNLVEARAMLSKAVSMKPSWPEAWAARAQLEYRDRKLSESVSDFSKAISLSEPRESWFYERGLAYAANKQYTQAIADYNLAIEMTQERRAPYLYQRGWAYWQMQEGEKALADLSKAIALDPALTRAYATRGEIFASKKDWQNALADINAWVELDTTDEAYRKRAEVQRSAAGEPAGGTPTARKLSDSDPSNPNLAAPKLLFPADKAELKAMPRRTVCTWEPVAGAVSYLFEWDYNADGAWSQEGKSERTGYAVAGTSFFFDFPGKQTGRWRVSAVDAGGRRGRMSEWRMFQYLQ
jgi:TonB family protein